MMFSPLYLFSPFDLPKATWKSTVSLYPPWNRIFRGENVTLTCNRNNSLEVNSTKWTHNNTLLAVTAPSLDIVHATFQDSGEYRCWSKNLIPSQPVYLEVFSGKFQVYRNTDFPRWRMTFLMMGSKQVILRLRYQDGIQGLSLKTHKSLFLHLYSFCLLSIFWPSSNGICPFYLTADYLFYIDSDAYYVITDMLSMWILQRAIYLK